MITFRLWISYIGTHFSGFQYQDNARTVEGELKKSLREIVHQPIKLSVAGRTDAGVHARGQAVSVSLDTQLSSQQIMLALSSRLPNDMSVWRVDIMPKGFDARHHSIGKRYIYRIFCGLIPDPFLRSTSLHVRYALNVDAMAEAALLFVGEHDFSSFRSSACSASHARRYLWHVGVQQNGNIIDIDVRGNAFCMNMVRIIVGTLLEVGRGKMNAVSVMRALQGSDRTQAGPTAKAQGLCFDRVYYADDLSEAGIPTDAKFPRYPIMA